MGRGILLVFETLREREPFTDLMSQYDGTTGDPTNGISITDFVLDNVQGTVDSTATNIWILCGSGSCSDWTWTDVSVTGGKTSSDCLNVPSAASCSD